MKHIALVFAMLLGYNLAFSQTTDSTLFYFEEVNMFITIPQRFEIIPADEEEKSRQKGEKFLEDGSDVELDLSSTQGLLSIKDGASNYLNITVTPYEKDAESYNEEYELVKGMVYNSFAKQIDPKNIDTASSATEIDGLAFNKFEVTLKLDMSSQIRMILLNKRYKSYDFGICYVYRDKEVG